MYLLSGEWTFPTSEQDQTCRGGPAGVTRPDGESYYQGFLSLLKFISKITSPLAVQLFSSRSRQHSGSGRMSERHSQGILLHKLSWPPWCGQISCRAYSLDYSVGLWMAHKLPLRFQHCHLHHQKLSILNIIIQYYNMLGFTSRNNNTMYMIYQ